MLFKKRVSILWPIVLPLITFLFGSGTVWEFQKHRVETARLDIERAKASLELRSKMNELLRDIIKPEEAKNEVTWLFKIESFNAAERRLAELEGRQPTFYKILPPASPAGIEIH